MPQMTFELDLPDDLAQTAAQQGLLTPAALVELIRLAVANQPRPIELPRGPEAFQPWLAAAVAPGLMGHGPLAATGENDGEPPDPDGGWLLEPPFVWTGGGEGGD